MQHSWTAEEISPNLVLKVKRSVDQWAIHVKDKEAGITVKVAAFRNGHSSEPRTDMFRVTWRTALKRHRFLWSAVRRQSVC